MGRRDSGAHVIDTPRVGNSETDQARLRRLFDALLDTLLVEVSKPGARPALLAVARAFLKDNAVGLNRPASLQAGLASLKGLSFD